MGVSGRGKILLFLIVFAAIAAILFIISGRRQADVLQPDDIKFAEVYAEMALARETAGDNPDYLDSLYSGIYERYDVDSSWLFDYASTVSYDAEKQKMIWDSIVEKLDSLKTTRDPDSSLDQ